MPPKLNRVGQTYGQLTVVSEADGRAVDGSVQWLCSCSCGGSKVVSGGHLRPGGTQSCGCLQVQQQRYGSITHGHSTGGTSSTYTAWANMVARCTNPATPNYEHYGGRGITVCERWMKFEHFLQDMGEKPHGLLLDRKENDLGYAPGNCRWVTSSISNQNRRPSKRNV